VNLGINPKLRLLSLGSGFCLYLKIWISVNAVFLFFDELLNCSLDFFLGSVHSCLVICNQFLRFVKVGRFPDVFRDFVVFLLHQLVVLLLYRIHFFDTQPQTFILVFWSHDLTQVLPRLVVFLDHLNLCRVEAEIRRSGAFVPHDLFQVYAFFAVVGEARDGNFGVA